MLRKILKLFYRNLNVFIIEISFLLTTIHVSLGRFILINLTKTVVIVDIANQIFLIPQSLIDFGNITDKPR